MTRLLSLLCVAFAFAVTLSAADLSGSWALSGDIAGNPITATCMLKQTDTALEGMCKGDLGDSKATGTVDGAKVTLKYDIDFQGMMFTLAYEGTVDDTAANMKGTVDVAGAASGTFTAKKQ
jgi:hypothetical protein